MAQIDANTQSFISGGGTASNNAVPVAQPGSTTLAQDQSKAANQGKAGYDVLGNPISSPATTVQPTTLSGDKSQQNATNVQNLNQATQNNPSTNLGKNGDGSPATVQDLREAGGTFQGENGLTYYNYDSTPTTGQGSMIPGTTIPSTGDTGVDSTLKQMNDLKTSMDSTSAALIQNIQTQYQNLIAKQQDTNTRGEASLNQTLLMGGSSRYAQLSATGAGTSMVSAGLDKISTLQSQETDAVLKAQQAQQSGDMDVLNKQMAIYDEIRQQKQAEATKLNEALVAQNQQATKDKAIASVLSSGITSPTDIVNKLSDLGYTNISAKDVADTVANLTPDAKAVTDIMTSAAKNGASQDILTAIGKATTVAQAINAAGDSLQTATGTLGDYLQYKKDTEAQGLVPKDYQTYVDEQNKKASQAKINEAYAVKAAQNQADANFTESDKNQQKLEQQYRQVLQKEFSSRTGALGVENTKVNQANHLNSLITQYIDPKTGKYDIPKTQYTELVMGLANMISPTGTADVATRKDLNAFTAKSDLNGALQYLTGSPQNGNTQDMIQNLVDSVDRQAQTATQNREAALQNLRDQAPTDLDQSRIDALNKSTQMVPYAGENRIAKSNVDDFLKTSGSQTVQLSDGSHSMYYVVSKLYETPGATDKDVQDYLKAKGYIQ